MNTVPYAKKYRDISVPRLNIGAALDSFNPPQSLVAKFLEPRFVHSGPRLKVALRFSGVNFVSLNFIDYVSMAFVWETIASGTPAIYWTCRKRWDSADEVASEGCGWTHPFDLLLSRILTSCAEQELHLRQEDAYSDGIK